MKRFDRVLQHLPGKPRIEADPEQVIHHEIRVLQVASHTVLHVCKRRLAQKVAAKEKPCLDAALFQVLNQLIAREGRAVPYGEQETEP